MYKSIPENHSIKIEINDLKKELKQRPTKGVKIPQDRWPDTYVRKYAIKNLFKIDLSGARRIAYDLVLIEGKKRIRFIEYFSNHTEYDKRFGYD